MLQELITDFYTYEKHPEKPIFHRIKFDKIGRTNPVNIYLTKSVFFDLLTGRNNCDHHYRIFSWSDWRAAQLLGFELNENSPALGAAILIGRFTPTGGDLEDVQYITNQGKSYFQSAYKTINNREEIITRKINSENFMKMEEIIPLGAQGKAIYGKGNYIIDGPAGTGKSTTVLQKIKIFQNQGLSSKQIVILVKNEQVIQSFYGLLESININVNNISILSVKNFIDKISYNYSEKNITNQDLINAKNKVSKIIKLFKSCIDINTKNKKHVKELDKELEGFIINNPNLLELFSKFIITRDSLIDLKNNNSQEIFSNIKKRQLKIKEEKLVKKTERQLKKLNKEFYSDKTFLLLSKNELECHLMKRYANKYNNFMKSYHVVIIDEAQDVSSSNIEFIRLHSLNTILTGDELQKENIEGVGNWENLLHREEVFFKDGDLNIFKLKHNFRQTYELGSMSYNYRQLVLKQPIVDIKEEYFENQKGFRKPELVLINRVNRDKSFIELINKKINYIKSTFTDQFPLVIFYDNNKNLVDFKRMLDSTSITYTIDNGFDKKITLLGVDKIAGREFPVVIMPVNKNSLPNSIYVMISRAKFDLSIITFDDKVDSHIQTLIKENIITLTSL